MSKVAKLWIQELKKGGFEHTCKTKAEFKKLTKLPRLWKRILSTINLKSGNSCFEVGCGGGIHLVRLTLNDFFADGIDCSLDVIKRAKNFIGQVAQFDNRVNQIRIYNGDFLSMDYEFLISKLGKKYDLVFDVGVAEHFLEKSERLEFIKRKFQLAKEGGWVVSVIPSGKHPYREIQRSQKLGGYNIPEIDYTTELLEAEMFDCGAKEVIVLPHNIMGYLNLKPTIVKKGIYYLFQVLPQNLFKKSFLQKHAFSYITIGRK